MAMYVWVGRVCVVRKHFGECTVKRHVRQIRVGVQPVFRCQMPLLSNVKMPLVSDAKIQLVSYTKIQLL